MNAMTPPPDRARRVAPDRAEPAATEPTLLSVAAEGWLGLPVPRAFDRLLDRLEQAPDRR